MSDQITSPAPSTPRIIPVTVKKTPFDVKGAARRKTIKAFRRFLDALDAELHLYNIGSRQNEFAMLCFRYIRRAVRACRDESPTTAYKEIALTVLDLVTAWDEWLSRQKFSPPVLRLHETLGRMVKGSLKGWRTYWIQLKLPDSPSATSDTHAPPLTGGEEVQTSG